MAADEPTLPRTRFDMHAVVARGPSSAVVVARANMRAAALAASQLDAERAEKEQTEEEIVAEYLRSKEQKERRGNASGWAIV